jgi:hypothetical protein
MRLCTLTLYMLILQSLQQTAYVLTSLILNTEKLSEFSAQSEIRTASLNILSRFYGVTIDGVWIGN